MMIYHHTRFSSEGIIKPGKYVGYISLHCDLELEDSNLLLFFFFFFLFFFCMTLWPMMTHHHTKFGYKRLSNSEDILWTKADTELKGGGGGKNE